LLLRLEVGVGDGVADTVVEAAYLLAKGLLLG